MECVLFVDCCFVVLFVVVLLCVVAPACVSDEAASECVRVVVCARVCFGDVLVMCFGVFWDVVIL